VIYYNKYTRIVIIRVKRGLHNLLLQTMALISQIRTTDVSFRTIHIAGEEHPILEIGILKKIVLNTTPPTTTISRPFFPDEAVPEENF